MILSDKLTGKAWCEITVIVPPRVDIASLIRARPGDP
jgi:hypothetical protein